MAVDATVVNLKGVDGVSPVIKDIEGNLKDFSAEATKALDVGFNSEDIEKTSQAMEHWAEVAREINDVQGLTQEEISEIGNQLLETVEATVAVVTESERWNDIQKSIGEELAKNNERTQESADSLELISDAQEDFNNLVLDSVEAYKDLGSMIMVAERQQGDLMAAIVQGSSAAASSFEAFRAEVAGWQEEDEAWSRSLTGKLSSLGDLFKDFGKLGVKSLNSIRVAGIGVGDMAVKMWAKLSGPLAPLIIGVGALVAAFTAVTAAFISTEEGANKWAKAIAELKEAWGKFADAVVQLLAHFGEGFVDVLIKGMEALSSVLETVAGWLEDILGLLKSVKEGFIEAFIALQNFFFGSEGKQIEDLTGGRFNQYEGAQEDIYSNVSTGPVPFGPSPSRGGNITDPNSLLGRINSGIGASFPSSAKEPTKAEKKMAEDQKNIGKSVADFIGKVKAFDVKKAVGDLAFGAGEGMGRFSNLAADTGGMVDEEGFQSSVVGAKGMFSRIQNSAASGAMKSEKETAKNTKDTVEAVLDLPEKLATRIIDLLGLAK